MKLSKQNIIIVKLKDKLYKGNDPAKGLEFEGFAFRNQILFKLMEQHKKQRWNAWLN